jgi:broad specificity phosphatase PhoE
LSTLILLRHGQAAFGADHYDQLSPLGEAQARAAAELFRDRDWHFKRVISGPRQRQRLTAALASGRAIDSLDVDPRLDEFAEGSQILAAAERRAGQPLEGTARLKAYMAEIRLWSRGEAIIDGVPDADAFRRTVDDWLAAVTADRAPGQRILAVTSAGVIAALLCRVLGQGDGDIAHWMGVLGNGSLTTLLFSGGRVAVRDINGSGHLPRALLSGI